MTKQMTTAQRALWSLVVEIGGDAEVLKLHNGNVGAAFERAIKALEEDGITENGRLHPDYY